MFGVLLAGFLEVRLMQLVLGEGSSHRPRPTLLPGGRRRRRVDQGV